MSWPFRTDGSRQQWPVPVAVDQSIAALLPDATPEHRQDVFSNMVEALGGCEAAVDYFRQYYEASTSGVVIGRSLPPDNAELYKTRIGPFTIFYHSTYPAHLQNRSPFTWNFYIADGRDQRSIMPDWAERGIAVQILGYTGEWEDCTWLTVVPETRVRISYNFKGHKGKEELIFPPDPNVEEEEYIPVTVLGRRNR